MKRFRSAIILLVVLLSLGGLAYWDEWKTKSEETAEKDKNKLLSLNKDAVEKILYRSADASNPLTVELEKNNNKWTIVSPVRFSAEDAVINNMLQAIDDYKYESVVAESEKDWARFGVLEPQRLIRLEMKGGKHKTIYLGEKSPVGFSCYVRTSDSDKTYVGSQHLMTSTEKKLADFRDKTFLSLQENALLGIELTRKGKTVRLERGTKDDKFEGVAPEKFAADKDAISDFISGITSERAEDFVDQPEAKLVAAFAPGKAFATVRWSSADGAKGEARFAEYEGKFWGAFTPAKLVYKLGDGAKTKLEKDAWTFRDRTVLKVEAKDMARIDLDGEVYVKSDGDWRKEGEKKAKPVSRIQSLAVDLEFAKAEKIISAKDAASITSKAPEHRVKIAFAEKSKIPEVTIDFWNDDKKPAAYVVKHSNSAQVYEVNKSSMDNLEEKQPGAPHASLEDQIEDMGTDEGISN